MNHMPKLVMAGMLLFALPSAGRAQGPAASY
jgi:hypothetical protein